MTCRQKLQLLPDIRRRARFVLQTLLLAIPVVVLGAAAPQAAKEDLTLPTASEVKAADKPENKAESTTVKLLHRPESASFKCPTVAGGSVCRTDEHWVIAIGADEYTLETVSDRLHALALLSPEPEINPRVGMRMSARRIVLRADQTAPYGHVQKIVELCAKSAIYKIAVAARTDKLEGNFECWLPIEQTASGAGAAPPAVTDIRVALFWDGASQKMIRKLGTSLIQTDAELLALMQKMRDDAVRLEKPVAAVIIDAEPAVPWNDIVQVINLSKKLHLDKIEFAMSAK